MLADFLCEPVVYADVVTVTGTMFLGLELAAAVRPPEYCGPW